MDKKELLNSFIDWKYPKFDRINPLSWFDNSILQKIYENTTGPFNSPDPVECFILYQLSKNSKYDVLEIGSWKGRSSCFLCQGIKDSHNTKRKVNCIDWFKGDNTGGADPSYEEMVRSLSLLELEAYANIYIEDMLFFNYEKLPKIDLVFYDSDHLTCSIVMFLSSIYEFLDDDCLICIHDAEWVSSRNAIDTLTNLYQELILFKIWEGFSILCKK